MRYLLLMRHAKAETGGPGAADRDRPLVKRGLRDAALIGAAVARGGMTPDLVLCSPSARTRETLDAMLPCFAGAPRVVFDEALYGASEPEYLRAITEADDDAGRLLIVGHNPTMHASALALAGSGDRALRERLTAKFPTAALAIIAFSCSAWSKTAPGGGELVSLLLPRDLGAEAAES